MSYFNWDLAPCDCKYTGAWECDCASACKRQCRHTLCWKNQKKKIKLHFIPVGVKNTASHEVNKSQCKALSQKGRNWVERKKDFERRTCDERIKRRIKWNYDMTLENYVTCWGHGKQEEHWMVFVFRRWNEEQREKPQRNSATSGRPEVLRGTWKRSAFIGLLFLSDK